MELMGEKTALQAKLSRSTYLYELELPVLVSDMERFLSKTEAYLRMTARQKPISPIVVRSEKHPAPQPSPPTQDAAPIERPSPPKTAKDPEPERPLCKELTKAGTPCKNRAQPGQDYCKSHAAVAE